MSTIVIQRLVNDHTSYIISLRAKYEAGRVATEYWSASNLCDNLDSYTPVERGGLQGTDRVVTTCRLPLNRGKGQCIDLSLHTQAPRLRIQKLLKSPRVPDPMDRQVKNLSTPKGTMNHHLKLSSNSTHISHTNN